MKPVQLIILLSMMLASCGHSRGASRPPKESYEDFLASVKIKRNALKNESLTNTKEYLFTLIDEKIPAYWTGTEWDFNGVTRTPGKGKIACGYFITNTLTDIGFDIERIKLAQAASSVLIKAVCTHIEYPGGFEKLKKYILKEPDHSVFIVGLDFHTGYMTRDGNKIYFIHSNYINKKGVMKEEADKSEALKSSNTFMIGNISENETLLKAWVQ